ncbi:hypothetical protein EYZ11_012684 [Aspergillus tanneri]|uniref:Enoyl reductase (ER) domain-containing protein n=1 Tax=Aspergillus tanneri TaxID=1220188 RepID=A0A4S3IZL3_9EURO|nr:uncharacterized protein ATNIH1004_003013 [Aspergillus tanneri]KAA8650329.1 hypothetical protein ATNIH1004_003013 [Aspergillus tanneri]THC87873.1 hypothetical protein EYZ11_012684 [Aspergillus tanneri]
MSHLAAIIPDAKAPLRVQEVETPHPGPHELLIKNELISLQPIDAKFAKLAIFPVEYPAILGMSYGGRVAAVGSEVTNFKVGDIVAAAKTAGAAGNKFGAFQRYVIARDITTSKISESVDLTVPVTLIGNLSTAVGLFNASVGLERPDPNGQAPARGKKVLIYGGTSSFGSLSVQYVAQAGYNVITTTSPKHKDLVSKLGAVQVIDHTQVHEALVKALVKEGPYDLVVDSISLPNTIQTTAAVVAAQGGGNLHTLLPAIGPESLPQGVTRQFASWSVALVEEKNAGLLTWAFKTYLPQVTANGKAIPLPSKKASGGLEGLNDALDILLQGVSGQKIVIDPWE